MGCLRIQPPPLSLRVQGTQKHGSFMVPNFEISKIGMGRYVVVGYLDLGALSSCRRKWPGVGGDGELLPEPGDFWFLLGIPFRFEGL